MLKSSIFKKYDVRGLYPKELDEDVVKIIVRTYVRTYKPNKVLVGHDCLEGSLKLYPVVCEELLKYGVDVYKIGQVSSPMLYFASPFYGIAYGIILTPSHAGSGHTGLKLVERGLPPTAEEFSAFKNLCLEPDKMVPYANVRGKEIALHSFFTDYTSKIIELVGNIPNTQTYKMIIDSGNGPNGFAARTVFGHFNLSFRIINEQVLRTNLAHESNPKIQANRDQLKSALLAENYDFGIIWDGDCDRVLFIDGYGELIPPEFVAVKIGAMLVSQGLGNVITVDVRASSAVEEELGKIGGEVKRIPAWNIPIKYEMQANPNIVFGIETSGHAVFRDMYRSDDGLLAALMFVKAVCSSTRTLKDELREFRAKYKIYEEINFETTKSESELTALFEKRYKDASISKIDGITIEYPGWRFNVRSSRTEPLIRLNISGTDFEQVEKNLLEISNCIGGKVVS